MYSKKLGVNRSNIKWDKMFGFLKRKKKEDAELLKRGWGAGHWRVRRAMLKKQRKL